MQVPNLITPLTVYRPVIARLLRRILRRMHGYHVPYFTPDAYARLLRRCAASHVPAVRFPFTDFKETNK